MENMENMGFCIANNREILKAGIISFLDEIGTRELNELYTKAEELRSGKQMVESVKQNMIQYMVERMQEADAGKVRTLFLCATNIL